MHLLTPMPGAPRLRLLLVKVVRLTDATVRNISAQRITRVGIPALAFLLLLLSCTEKPAPTGDTGPPSASSPVSQAPDIPTLTPATESQGEPTSTSRPGPAPVPTMAFSPATPVATTIPIPPTPVPTAPIPTVPPARDVSTATDEEIESLVAGNSSFALGLYRTLSAGDGNLFFSPYSISQALAMTYAGARGETERQMADTLHFTLPQDTLHPAFNSIFLDLDSRGGGKGNNDPSAFRLNIANSLWAQYDYSFLDEFLAVVAKNYGAGVIPLDFRGEPEKSRLRINEWVASETEDRIRDLIQPGIFEDQPPALALVNAIYFNAGWTRHFTEVPRPMPFLLLDGGEGAVPMMERTDETNYAIGDGYQAVDLDYKFSDMSMTILLPDAGNFEAFESSLDDKLLGRTLEDLDTREVMLTMPGFEFSSTFALADTLNTMGMPDAFDALSADFSGMDGRSCATGDVPCLLVSKVIHKAFVLVDEEGTEAAAATAVIVILESEPLGPPVELTIDRPFIFLIRDKATGTILFMGRVLDPRS